MKRILSTALAIVLFIGAAQAQTTEEGKGHHSRKGGDMYKSLNLTADQQAKIKSIRESQKEEMKALKEKGKTEAGKATRKELHSKYKSQFESVLTQAQKDQLTKKQADWKSKSKEGKGKSFGKKGDRKGGREFGKELNLSADQQTKVKSINSEFKTKMQALHSNTAVSKEEKKEQMKQLAEAHKTNLKSVLTQEQIKKMEEGRGKRKAKATEK